MKYSMIVVTGAWLAAACNGSHASPPPASAAPVDSAARETATPAAIAASAPAAAASAPASAAEHTWSFDGDAADAPPVGFVFSRTGSGRPGRWVVRAEAGAPSGAKVLAQLDADTTDYRFPVAVAGEPTMRDGSVSVRCKPVSGHVDEACGLVFRYRDADNYYVTRANALEGNVRLYHVAKGERKQFATWSGPVSSGAWHSLRADARGSHFEVYWDDKKIIDAHDSTFTEAGKAGVWTKADSVTYFDDLKISPH